MSATKSATKDCNHPGKLEERADGGMYCQECGVQIYLPRAGRDRAEVSGG